MQPDTDATQSPSGRPLVHIRRGVASDAAALAEFAARTFNETFAAENKTEDLRPHPAGSHGIAQQTKELVDPDGITVLVEQGGRLIAYAQIRRSVPPACVTQDHAVELFRFYVDRPAQGSRFALVLMLHVHRAARELGGTHLWLGVWEHNDRARVFYSKMGFVDVGSHAFYVGSGRRTARVMVARVPNLSAA